jgi:CRP/FNR family transcriptional regulator, anaerobic regulatory protein
MTAITADMFTTTPFARAHEALSSIMALHGRARMAAWARSADDDATRKSAVNRAASAERITACVEREVCMVLTATAARPNPRTAIGTAKQATGSDVGRRGLKVFAATEPLFSLGDPKTDLYLIENGAVAVYEPRFEGRQAILEFAFPGDIVGLGFLQTHTCNARASIEMIAHCVPFSAQDRLVGDDPRSQAALANAIEREFEFLRRSSIKFSRENPLGRVAAFLLTLSRQNEEEGRDPRLLTQPLQCGVVADFLALSIDRLGSLLVRLEQRGIIAPCPPHGLRLSDLNALRALVDEM